MTETSLPIALLEETREEQPRYAARRALAARIARLPERMLLNRARGEGDAHRRSESAEQAALQDLSCYGD